LSEVLQKRFATHNKELKLIDIEERKKIILVKYIEVIE